VSVVHEDGRLLFTTGACALTSYERGAQTVSTPSASGDLDHRTRVVGCCGHAGALLNEEVVWRQGELLDLLISYVRSLPWRTRRGRRRKRLLALRHHAAASAEQARLRSERRLGEAIEALEGFVCYDGEDQLVICSSCYRDLLYPGWTSISAWATFEASSAERRAWHVRMQKAR
jgi:hypothetical protein